jgi:outer membrane protein OmpA-like peptidoglycan-associated protein
MRKLVSFFSIILFSNAFITLSGQVPLDTIIIEDVSRVKPILEPDIFSDNLFVETAIGTQVLFSTDVNNLDFTERFTPYLSLSVGKWFSPYWGASINVQGFALNGFSTLNGLYLADPQTENIYGNNDPVRDNVTIRPDGTYRHFIRYSNINIGFQLSLMNLIKGYDEQNSWDIIPSLGFGYMRVSDYMGIANTNTISTNFELMGKYHLNEKIDLNIKSHIALIPDQFDGRIAGDIYESYSSISIGATYFFKKRGFKRVKQPKAIKIYVTDTVYQDIKQIDTIYQVIKDTITIEVILPKEEAKILLTEIDLKFNFDSIQLIDQSQEIKIEELAGILNKNSDMKLRIIGHTCDIASLEQNIMVGLARAESIAKKLISKGVSASQLKIESKAFEDPLVPNTNEENRAKNRRVQLILE